MDILAYKFVWHGHQELRLYWDVDQYLSDSTVSINDDEEVIVEACCKLLREYAAEIQG